jgi:hypothetical protein
MPKFSEVCTLNSRKTLALLCHVFFTSGPHAAKGSIALAFHCRMCFWMSFSVSITLYVATGGETHTQNASVIDP